LLLVLRGVRADGAVAEALVELCCARGLEPVISGRHARALLVPAGDAERYLEAAISPGKRKELRRQERRLAELGALSYTLLDARDDPGAALDELLALEAAGWKGRAGGALGCDPADRRFFEAACRAAHAEGRLILTALRVAGRAVAAKCSFLAVPGAFAFKIAYDERYARYSPGVLLELDHVRRLHARPDVAWMDSCAAWDHPMINGLWSERRTLETVLLAPGGGPLPRAVAAATPLLRLGARLLGRSS
jgi:hypothetical protein